MTDQEKAEIAKAVTRAVAEYVETVKEMDLDGVREFWADTDGFVVAGDGTLIASHEEWISKVKEMWAEMAEVNSVELFNPQIYVLADDAASYALEFRTSITSKDGETAIAHGSWMYVFKYLDGRWRVVHSAGTHVPD
jgi:ketosteroid isomerase-like protein